MAGYPVPMQEPSKEDCMRVVPTPSVRLQPGDRFIDFALLHADDLDPIAVCKIASNSSFSDIRLAMQSTDHWIGIRFRYAHHDPGVLEITIRNIRRNSY